MCAQWVSSYEQAVQEWEAIKVSLCWPASNKGAGCNESVTGTHELSNPGRLNEPVLHTGDALANTLCRWLQLLTCACLHGCARRPRRRASVMTRRLGHAVMLWPPTLPCKRLVRRARPPPPPAPPPAPPVHVQPTFQPLTPPLPHGQQAPSPP